MLFFSCCLQLSCSGPQKMLHCWIVVNNFQSSSHNLPTCRDPIRCLNIHTERIQLCYFHIPQYFPMVSSVLQVILKAWNANLHSLFKKFSNWLYSSPTIYSHCWLQLALVFFSVFIARAGTESVYQKYTLLLQERDALIFHLPLLW